MISPPFSSRLASLRLDGGANSLTMAASALDSAILGDSGACVMSGGMNESTRDV